MALLLGVTISGIAEAVFAGRISMGRLIITWRQEQPERHGGVIAIQQFAA